MTTATHTPTSETGRVDAAREQVRRASAAKEDAAQAAKTAARAAKNTPDDPALAEAARQTYNAQRRAARALKKAEDALAEISEAADIEGEAPEALGAPETPEESEVVVELSPVEAATAELRRAEATLEECAAATKAADAAAAADAEDSSLFAAARKARWDELKAGKAVQKATAALAALSAPDQAEKDAGVERDTDQKAPEAVSIATATAPTTTPSATVEPAPTVPATLTDPVVQEGSTSGDSVADAEKRVTASEEATKAAEQAAEADPDNKQLMAVARHARSEQRKAARALKKARQAAEEAGEAAETAEAGDAQEAEATEGHNQPSQPGQSGQPADLSSTDAAENPAVVPAAASAVFLQDTLALVRSGASVLAVAADASERAAAADPANTKLAAAATAARAAAQQAAQAVIAAEALHGITSAVPLAVPPAASVDAEAGTDTSNTATSSTETSSTAQSPAVDSDEPAVAEDPAVTAAREELSRVEATVAELAAATRAAEAAAEAEPGNSDLFSAARKARWDELKASKAVQKATAAVEKAIADAPPAPKVLTEEEKLDRAAPKPQGQWIIDGHKPLNGDERIKQEDAGLAVADRVRNIYAKEGFDSIPAEDLAPRFKWIGMYTQRRQDMDGEQTGTLTNAELQDRYFMMRVRLDGGQVTPAQLRVIGEISSEFARGSADFTDRQNIQLHWIRIEDVPEIWDRLATVGLDTYFGCGDVPRVILGSPVAGVSKDEIIDATPAIKEIKKNWLIRDEFSNLPRKFKTAISGSRRQDVTHEIQDLAFIGSEHPEKGPGFDVWVGGGLSTNPMFSQRLGAWVSIDEIPEVWAGIVRIFRDYGYRKLRNRARLKFLVADWGVEKFRRILEEDYLGHALTDGPEPEVWPGYRDHVGVYEQQDGRFYVGVKPTVGHTEGDQLQRLADLAESHGITEIRTTPDKELLFLNIDKDAVDDLTAALEKEGLSARPSSFRRDIISCTGLEFCKLALVTTKQRAITLADQLETRLDDLDVPLKISLNGCPNSCARTQVADIGLKGQIVTDDNGKRVEGFQVHLGGSLGMHPDWGKKLRGHKVTSAGLDDYVVRVVENYKANRNSSEEQFRDWVLRAPEEQLQ